MDESKTMSRLQTLGEEIANSISHGVGVLGAIAITPIMIVVAVPKGAAAVVGVSIFGFTMLLLYLSSTLYHAFPHNRAKKIFQVFDHSAIFLLIAGTYTPFTLSLLPPAWGWTLFGLVWSLAIFGVLLKTVHSVKIDRLSMALYIGMGWLALIAVKPLWDNLSAGGLIWLLMGGVMYTVGVLFFAYDHRIRYSHFVWHLFVLAGTVCHVVTVLVYVIA